MAESYSVTALLKADATGFTKGFKDASNAAQGLDKSVGNSGLTIGKLAAAIGVTALVAKGFNMVRDSVGRAFGRIDTMEQFERVMTTMTGSNKKANEVLAKTNDIVTGTAYGLDVGAQAVQNFVTSNMDVDKATDTIASWGDAVAFYGDGSNESFASVSDALAKMTAKGKVQMDTMNRLTEAGVPAMQIYADATGKSVEEVAEQMQKGKLDAGKFTDVMNDALKNGTKNFKGIGGAAKEAGASWGGTFDNMKAAVARGVTNIIQNIDTMLKDNGLPDMRALIGKFGKKFENVLKSVGDKIPIVVNKIKEVKKALEPWLPIIKPIAVAITGLVSAIITLNTTVAVFNLVKKAIIGVNKALFGNPIVLIVAAIIGAATLIYIYWEPISKFFTNLWKNIKNVASNAWNSMKDIWISLVDWLKGVWNGVIDFFKKWGTIVIDAITSSVGSAVALVIKYWESIKGFFSNLWDSIKNIWSGVSSFFSNLWEGVTSKVKDVWGKLSNGASQAYNKITTVFKPMTNFFQNTFGNIVDTVSNIFGRIGKVVSNIGGNLKTIGKNAFTILKNVVVGALLLLVNLVTFNFGELKKNAIAIWNNIKESALNIWNSIIDIFKTILETYLAIFTDAFTLIHQTVVSFFTAIKETAVNVWNAIVDFIFVTLSSIDNKFSEIMDSVMETLVSAWMFIDNLWRTALSLILGENNQAFQTIKNHIEDAMEAVWNIVETIWNFVKETFLNATAFLRALVTADFGVMRDIVGEQMTLIKNTIKKIWDNVKVLFKSVLAAIWGIVKEKFNQLKESALNALKNMLSGIKTAWNNTKTTFSNSLSSIWNSTKQKFEDIKNAVKTKMENVVTTIKTTWEKAKSFLSNIDLKQIGADIINGLIKGIKDKVEAVKNAVKDVTSAITGKLKSILKIKSPSRVFMGFGGFISEGLAIGIDRASGLASRAAEFLGNSVTDAFNPDLSINRDMASEVNRMNSQAQSQFSNTVKSELSVNKQPARISLNLGGNDFEAFVDNINEVNAVNATLRRF